MQDATSCPSCHHDVTPLTCTSCCHGVPGPSECQPSQHTGMLYQAIVCYQIASPSHQQLEGQIGGHGCCQILLNPAMAQAQLPPGTEAVMLLMHSLRPHKPHMGGKVLLGHSCRMLVSVSGAMKTRALTAGQLLLPKCMGSHFQKDCEVGRQTEFPASCQHKTKR